MKYEVELSPKALNDILRLKKSGEIKILKKIESLLCELENHPMSGTGKVERLKKDKSGLWSRRITDKHRLIYEVSDEFVKVLVLSTYGHYEDK